MVNGMYHMKKNYFESPLEFDDGFIAQAGRLYCKSNTVVDTHIHTELFELTIVTDGEGTVTTNGISVPVKKGDIYLTLPYDSHKIETDRKNPLKFDFFAFTVKNEPFAKKFDSIVEKFHASNMRIFYDEHIPPLVGDIIAELNNRDGDSDILMSAFFREIMVFIIRGFDKVSPNTKSNTEVTSAEAVCYNLMNYIDTHIYSMKKLEDLSDAMGYSYGHLSSIFKKTTSGSLSEYYNNKKMEIAAALVLEDRLKIVEISELLNYSSAYSFSRAFSQHFGMSPKHYRNSKK